MMFSGPNGANPLSIFKWKRRGESSLAESLLKDVPPEIELSDYGRVPPSPGSESPSGLLYGESLNVEPIADLDLFFERLYSYYSQKGLRSIIIKWIFELLMLAFVIAYSGFFLLVVDWNFLWNAKCGMDAIESKNKPCDLVKEALHQHPLTPLTLTRAIIVGYLGLLSIYWIFCFLRFFAQLKDTLGIRHFYYNNLHVTDDEIKTMPWATILEKVVRLQSSQQLCVVKDLSAHDIVMRLMRKENYLIGMLNKGVLAFPVSQWVPGVGPMVKIGSDGRQHRLILTKTLEWALNWCCKPKEKPKLPKMSAPTIPDFLLFLLLHLCLFHTKTLRVQALTSPTDISALKSFKASIKPSSIPPWSCLASWNFTTDPCTVPHRTSFTCGLTCNPDSTRVIQLVLDPAGYSGTLTPLISQLSQLTYLDLSDNSFFGPIPSSISSLSNLQTLSLRSNSFSGSIPVSIASLKSLDSLDLSHNSLTGFLPNSFNSLSNLRRLDLSYNKLTGSLPKLPPNLLELALKHNSLSGYLSNSSFDGLTQLEVVELSENSFTGTLQPWFFLLPSLQQVDLANNSLTRVEVWKPAGGNSNLVAVDLGFNGINGYLPVNFASYPVLASLTLRYNRIRGKIPLEYSKNKFLRRLYLDGNFLIGKPPAEFFAGGTSVSGSLGYNCLQACPASSQLCVPSQKPNAMCKHAYGHHGDEKPRS